MLFGTTPQFDMAIYTLCFLLREGRNRCPILLGDCTEVNITSAKMPTSSEEAGDDLDERKVLATAYPDR